MKNGKTEVGKMDIGYIGYTEDEKMVSTMRVW